MADLECFAFFCEDFRSEVGGKMSYMGILGPKIEFGPVALGQDPKVKEVLSKVVAVALIRTKRREDVKLSANLIIENGPDGLEKNFMSDHVIPVNHDFDEMLVQFNAQMPNIPAHPGMKITIKFDADGVLFEASLTFGRNRSNANPSALTSDDFGVTSQETSRHGQNPSVGKKVDSSDSP